jgi:hypothetical protein
MDEFCVALPMLPFVSLAAATSQLLFHSVDEIGPGSEEVVIWRKGLLRKVRITVAGKIQIH